MARRNSARPSRTAARRELLEETGLAVGPLTLAAHVDNIRRDADGRVRFHYTIIDFAAPWVGGEPVAGDDVSALVWAPFDALADHALWPEAMRVINLARARLELRLNVTPRGGPANRLRRTVPG